MLTNLRIFKYGLWIQYAVDKITNNYFTGTVKEITYPRVPLTNLDLKVSLARLGIVKTGLGNPRLSNFP